MRRRIPMEDLPPLHDEFIIEIALPLAVAAIAAVTVTFFLL